MATAKATTKPQEVSNNDHWAEEAAGDFPRYMIVGGDEIVELSHFERAMLKFSRALPEDLLADFDACMEAFKAKLEPRRNELVGW